MVDILVVYKKNFEAVHDESLNQISTVLDEISKQRGLRVDIRARERVRRADFIGRDLVIVLGGDGTLTSISHNIDANTPVMGVNSLPRDDDEDGSFGFYMDSSIHTFAEDIQIALDGKAIVNDLPRLQAIVDTTSGNRFTTDPAMNDLLIANTHQYAPSRYYLRRGDDKLVQQSSGLIFSTWLGKGAWLSHAANEQECNRISDSIDSETVNSHYFMLARDIPHSQRKANPWASLAWTSEPTTLTSDMHRGMIVPDGWDETHFNRGATITVNLEAPKIRLLTFRQSMMQRLKTYQDR
jgi:NAD kinase